MTLAQARRPARDTGALAQVHARRTEHPRYRRVMIDATTGWYVVPATIKAVVLSPDGCVLLARNLRGEWELPGGWPTREDETVGDVIRREVAEEASIEVDVGSLLHVEL